MLADKRVVSLVYVAPLNKLFTGGFLLLLSHSYDRSELLDDGLAPFKVELSCLDALKDLYLLGCVYSRCWLVILLDGFGSSHWWE